MNISPLCSCPIDILVGVINGSYDFGLLVMLTMDGPQELVARCSKNPNQTSISLWHRLYTPACYSLMPNIPF
jgi:hypothetical protein